jgi:23S rRNA (guanine2445-N2)-methyltransferase / 23S rRNA (guanine2069-N7)-methyltransferase
MRFFATTPKSVEALVADELALFGATDIRPTSGGVHFGGTLEAAYRACLWSRFASRILMPLVEVDATEAAALHAGVTAFAWEEHLSADGTLAVDFTGTNEALGNTLHSARVVKDAVVDRFRAKFGRRPSVDLEQPDLRLNVHLNGTRGEVRLDLSGRSLHRRGYRLDGMVAPMKENLAAAILARAGWPAIAAAGGALLDPLCGSGTLPIEAALMAADIAPGGMRPDHGFSRWPGHDAPLWDRLLAEARDRRRAGLSRLPPIHGSDVDPMAVEAARANANRAGLKGYVTLAVGNLDAAVPPEGAPAGLVAVNPPYGERLGTEEELRPLYETLGRVLRERFTGWSAAVYTGNPGLAFRLGIRARRHWDLPNGPIPCRLFRLEIDPSRFMRPSRGPADLAPEDLVNRLRKNLRTLEPWARREGVSCWRAYDADLPDYNVAVDLYHEAGSGDRWAVVQEYRAPAEVEPAKAAARLRAAVAAVTVVLAVPPDRVVMKERLRQKGHAQYEKRGDAGRFLTVIEGGSRFLVNLADYLDTGLFLDHRPVRAMIREMAGGTRFLNLFCYTGSATVAAAAGGARSTVSVDLSSTYLDWARRNLEANGFGGRQHELVRGDCRRWLEAERRRFDLILLDSPAFSTSKAMDGTIDIQRDHVPMILAAARLLAPRGTLIFSTNLRRFKLDVEGLSGLAAEDITPRTIPPDFARNPRIHTCFLLRRGEDAGAGEEWRRPSARP